MAAGSLANKRNHVRAVLLGMICAVYIHRLFAERSYMEKILKIFVYGLSRRKPKMNTYYVP